eukprot:jgi/Bigna1/87153/estExt_fgenesh1_pg.C_170084
MASTALQILRAVVLSLLLLPINLIHSLLVFQRFVDQHSRKPRENQKKQRIKHRLVTSFYFGQAVFVLCGLRLMSYLYIDRVVGFALSCFLPIIWWFIGPFVNFFLRYAVGYYLRLPMGHLYQTRSRSVFISADDGVKLSAQIISPVTDEPRPAILIRTPYSRWLMCIINERFAERGFHVVVADCRGRFSSEGDFEILESEKRDGVSTLSWLASQPWFSGDFGLIGVSYDGYCLWAAVAGYLAMPANPRLRLRACVPVFTSCDLGKRGMFSGGILQLELIARYCHLQYRLHQPSTVFGFQSLWLWKMLFQVFKEQSGTLWNNTLKHLPLKDLDKAVLGVQNGQQTKNGDDDSVLAKAPRLEIHPDGKHPYWDSRDHSESLRLLAKMLSEEEKGGGLMAGWKSRRKDKDTANSDSRAATATATYEKRRTSKTLPHILFCAGWYDLFSDAMFRDFVTLKNGGTNIPKKVEILDSSIIVSACCLHRIGLATSTVKKWRWDGVSTRAGHRVQNRQMCILVKTENLCGRRQVVKIAREDVVQKSDGAMIHVTPLHPLVGTSSIQGCTLPFPHRKYEKSRCCAYFSRHLFRQAGMMDNAEMERTRNKDIMIFTSPKLQRSIEITGRVKAELFVSYDTAVCDLYFRLCYVDNRNRSLNLCDGILRVYSRSQNAQGDGDNSDDDETPGNRFGRRRVSYMSGPETPSDARIIPPRWKEVPPLESLREGEGDSDSDHNNQQNEHGDGKDVEKVVQRVKINSCPIAAIIPKGSRLRLQISGGAFPRYARNLGYGAHMADETKMRATNHTLYVGMAARPSKIVLPVIECS